MPTHHFISYSNADAADFALKLCDALAAGPPQIPVWLDKLQLLPGRDWGEQLAEAIKICQSLIFIMTRDSVEPTCTCTQEWTRALKYKKPIIPLRLHADAELPFRLEPRQYIDFTGNFDAALAQLRNHLQWLSSPAGVLQSFKDRLADAKRDLRRATDATQQVRIKDDIAQLEKQIAEQQRIVDDPKAAAERVAASIAAGLEREREPQKSRERGDAATKFINPPPMTAPSYFQNRFVETKLIADFLRDDSRRMLTLVGRGGTGKTALACRLLKALEHGHLPDDLGSLAVDGIVYLSAVGTRRVNVPDLYADLLKMLPPETARHLENLYKNPQTSTEAKMRALLAAFPHGRYIVLLDNFEDVVDVDAEALALRDAELEEALTALLQAPPHAIKAIITTRAAPRSLALVQPARQTRLDLDEGLASPFAENILREMDVDGKVGLKTAPEDLLAEGRFRTRGYPRALEALFAILSADRDTTLREILDNAAQRLPENVVRDMVGEAFDRLDLTAQKVMQALAIYGRPVTTTAVDYLLQPFLTGVNSAPVLSRLVNMHFVRKEAGRYYLHPVDREYALSRVPRGQTSDRKNEDKAPAFTQIALAALGADYFKTTRLPREQWKTITDLAPQLAEFDLRCAAEDYDMAAEVLTDIDFDCLLLWGHYRLMVDLHEHLQGKLKDANLKRSSLSNLGFCYRTLGQIIRAIEYHEQALAMAREIGNRKSEGNQLGFLGLCYRILGQITRAIEYHEQALAMAREIRNRKIEGHQLGNLGLCYQTLGQFTRAIEYHEHALAMAREIGKREIEGHRLDNLGLCYQTLGQLTRAIEYHEQALAIAREIGDRRGEGADLGNLGTCYSALGQTSRAIEYHEQTLAISREIGDRRGEGTALGNLAEVLINEGRYADAIQHAEGSVKIAKEINNPNLGNFCNGYLALAHLYAGNVHVARATAEAASQYNEPRYNHYVLALLGVIALRQADRPAAQEAFAAAKQQAEQLLSHSAQNYAALDSKGLALSGLALCEGQQHVASAIAAYRAARAINKDAGIVKRVLRLFDELAKADANGVLAEVRAAAAGE